MSQTIDHETQLADETTTALAVVQKFDVVATFTNVGGARSILDKIKEEVSKIDVDISTATGRANIKSLAYKLRRSKTTLDDAGKALKADIQKQCDLIDGERKVIRDELDAFVEEFRKPLTDYENAEKMRVSVRENRILQMSVLSHHPAGMDYDIDYLNECLADLDRLQEFDWQEFVMRAEATANSTRQKLEAMKADRIKRDEEAAELKRLREEQAERERKEREDRIAANAAAKAKQEAEDKAKREQDERDAKAKEEQDRLEQERIAADKRAADEKARADKAEADRILAEQKAASDKIAAEADAKRREEQAAQDERDRQLREKQAEEEAARKRAADIEHKSKINNAALAEIMKRCTPELMANPSDLAKAIIVAIAKGEIPHITIKY